MSETIGAIIAIVLLLGGAALFTSYRSARRHGAKIIELYGKPLERAPVGDEAQFFVMRDVPAFRADDLAAPPAAGLRYEVPMEFEFGDAAPLPPPPIEFDGRNPDA